MDAGYWILDVGYWILDIGYWMLVLEQSLQGRLSISFGLSFSIPEGFILGGLYIFHFTFSRVSLIFSSDNYRILISLSVSLSK